MIGDHDPISPTLPAVIFSPQSPADRAGKQNLTFSKSVGGADEDDERSVMEDEEEKEKKP